VTVGCVFALLSLVNAQSLPNVVLVGVKPEKRLSVLGKLSSAGSKALDTLRKEGFLVREKSGIVVIIDKTSSPFAALDRTRAQIDVFARPGVESGVLEWSSLSSAERDSLVTRLELLAGAKLQSFKGSIALSASPVVLIQIGGRVVTDVTLGVDRRTSRWESIQSRRSRNAFSRGAPRRLNGPKRCFLQACLPAWTSSWFHAPFPAARCLTPPPMSCVQNWRQPKKPSTMLPESSWSGSESRMAASDEPASTSSRLPPRRAPG